VQRGIAFEDQAAAPALARPNLDLECELVLARLDERLG
jgi:hypothetical protein